MLSARAAILQALRRGPAYGREIARRVADATGGRASVAPASVYPTLRALEKAGLVRTWTVIPGRARGGRARRYHELTVLGIREAEGEGEALAGLALSSGGGTVPSASERAAMEERLERVADLYDLSRELRDGLARARRQS